MSLYQATALCGGFLFIGLKTEILGQRTGYLVTKKRE